MECSISDLGTDSKELNLDLFILHEFISIHFVFVFRTTYFLFLKVTDLLNLTILEV